jgi:UDP-2-acetamido-3-amino-2,3-dideoxy-glucuronate N-acetyltransferase
VSDDEPGPSSALEIRGCHLWRLPAIADARGRLTVAELAAMPFPVQRLFFITDVPSGETRGQGAHRTTQELLLALSGSLLVTLDDGKRKQDLLLRSGGEGLVVAPRIWCSLKSFSAEAVLAVFASRPFDAADQIRDYAEFLSMTDD